MANVENVGPLRALTPASNDGSAASGTVASRLGLAVLIAFLVILAIHGSNTLFSYVDYVGPDNDDTMRLVEVRDLLNGQGWFDLMQYRLGPLPGTLMHWSRFIDLPIVLLIKFFGLFLSPRMAEATALFVWPVSLNLPVLFFIGLGARRIGGEKAMVFAIAIITLFLISVRRFEPGGIDHHNAQMALIAIVAAALVDPRHRASSYGLAGLASAIALAIGAETTPLLGVASLIIAIRWAWNGESYARAATAFGLAFALLTAAAYGATVPAWLYTRVTCDNLSFGFLSLTVYGGLTLAAAAALTSRSSVLMRFGALGVIGAGAGVLILKVMPQCLGNPLASLDPLLVDVWLSHVQEALSVFAQAKAQPATVGGFYFVGLIAMAVCAWRIYRRDRIEVHAVLLALITAGWAISLVQVRATTFPQMLSALPLAVLVSELHSYSRRNRTSAVAGLPFAALLLASIPSFWFTSGFIVAQALGDDSADKSVAQFARLSMCTKEANLTFLNSLPKGMIAAPSNMGSPILRFTPHSVLAAPYHRNPQGMLAVIRAGLASPKDAQSILTSAGADYLVFCPGDGEMNTLIKRAPEGFFAGLAAGQVPSYLSDITPAGAPDLKVYRIAR